MRKQSQDRGVQTRIVCKLLGKCERKQERKERVGGSLEAIVEYVSSLSLGSVRGKIGI